MFHSQVTFVPDKTFAVIFLVVFTTTYSEEFIVILIIAFCTAMVDWNTIALVLFAMGIALTKVTNRGYMPTAEKLETVSLA